MKYAIISVIILAVLGISSYFFYSRGSLKQEESFLRQVQENEMLEKQSASKSATEKEGQKNMSQGPYIEYSKSAFDAELDKRRVLFFFANWCPTCKPTDADLKANVNKFPSDLEVFRVNYEDSDTDAEEKDLAKKYNITYQHTFVQVDEDGNEITKWNGGLTDKLLSSIK